MLPFAELLHGTFGQIGTIICNDTVRKAKPENHLLDELNCRSCITLIDWLCLHPLSEFINYHQKVGLLIIDLLKGPTISIPQVANDQVIGIILNS